MCLPWGWHMKSLNLRGVYIAFRRFHTFSPCSPFVKNLKPISGHCPFRPWKLSMNFLLRKSYLLYVSQIWIIKLPWIDRQYWRFMICNKSVYSNKNILKTNVLSKAFITMYLSYSKKSSLYCIIKMSLTD